MSEDLAKKLMLLDDTLRVGIISDAPRAHMQAVRNELRNMIKGAAEAEATLLGTVLSKVGMMLAEGGTITCEFKTPSQACNAEPVFLSDDDIHLNWPVSAVNIMTAAGRCEFARAVEQAVLKANGFGGVE